ncbi:MAG TPA: hypothetical protein VD788_05090 [Candidatus Polarisedimenticolaceae bacterium]|nr:hypothetical protein [Candidatus Polarisedimenticolaceae bacterium]
MQRHAVSSSHTGCEMPIEHYGSAGAAMIYVPTSGGGVDEFAGYGLPQACRPWLEEGSLQVFAIDGWARNTLWNEALSGAERMRAYAVYERYVADELLPWVAERTGGPPPLVVGCSFGAYVAANLLFKRPASVAGACGLGGVYGLWHRLEGHHDETVYFHTPLEYLPRLDDPAALAAIRRTSGFAIFAAADDEWLSSSLSMADIMRRKSLPHTLDLWPSPADHHEQWWRRQLAVFLVRRFGG